MIYITQLIYIVPGKEEVFHAFEDVAIPLMKKYGGTMIHRVRPTAEHFIESSTDQLPYEIHFISFASKDALTAFMQNEERKAFLHLKEASITSTLLVVGEKW